MKTSLAALLCLAYDARGSIYGGLSSPPLRADANRTKCIRCGAKKTPNRAFCSSLCCRLWKSGNKTPCETCGDTGRTMEMVCHGGTPYEQEVDCPDCNASEVI